MGWITRQLELAGADPTGPVEPVRTRPWAAIMRVDTDRGVVWFKESAPRLAYEPALTRLVAETGHPLAPEVLAAEGARLLTPDAGPRLRELEEPRPSWEELLALCADLQLALADRVDDALALGVPDKRPGALPDAYGALLERVELPDEVLARLRRLEPRLAELVEDVGDVVPPSLAHEEVHGGNVFVRDRPRLLDWGEAAVAHAFAGLPNSLRTAVWELELEPGGPEVERLCDAYLEPWTRYAPLTRLREIVPSAYALGCLGRALSWDLTLGGLSSEWRDQYTEPVPGWLELWADAAEGNARLGAD
jgi:hypothetical protein